MKKIVGDLEKSGQVEPTCSDWAATLLLVNEPQYYRFVVKCRELNYKIKKNKLAPQMRSDVIDLLNGNMDLNRS